MAKKQWYHVRVVGSDYGKKVNHGQTGALAAKILNDWGIKPEDCKPLGFDTGQDGHLGVYFLIYSDTSIAPVMQLGVSHLKS